ncbi:hypothetical protein R5R35_000162 [Gryllus longicercus]|uniref:Mitochondrial ornithine transporter n=1 Tax=Gryllus longicercus TaxID=2509291 RepID=A0AAN9V2E3_9ORTH
MAHSKGVGGTVHDAAIDIVAGSLAAVALVYVGQPFDTLKVKMQTFPEKYIGTWNCFKETMAKEGVRGLYAGTVSAIAANVAENAVLFSGYGLCQKGIGWAINQKPEELGVIANATAGSAASFFSSFTLCPPELIKCRAQALREIWERDQPKGQLKGQFHVSPMVLVRQIIKEDGPTGLFRGLVSTLVREVPGYFFFFGGYELTRELLAPPGVEKKDIGALRTMAAGAVGGSVFWLVMFPIDVVKSRIQVDGVRDPMFQLLVKIGREEGFRALYNGLTPTLIRTVPACATLFLVYEYSKQFLHSIFEP